MNLLKELKRNRIALEKSLQAIASADDPDERRWMCEYVVPFANVGGHSYYSSEVLERVYCDWARDLHVTLTSDYDVGTCLIVMGRFWEFGGHVRVVERWINADRSRKYSVAFTVDDESCLNGKFNDLVRDSGGQVHFLPHSGLAERGLALRELAAHFETVLLVADTEDVIPLIAFGTDEFKRPVGFYNHGDHLFWLGVSIADLVADMRIWGQKFSRKYRGVENSTIVTVPADVKEIVPIDRTEARRSLGLPLSAKIGITVGRGSKYVPSNGKDFLDLIRPLLKSEPDFCLVGIGMTFTEFPAWRRLAEEFGGRIKVYGCISHDKLYPYYFASDLALDSFPFNGIAALADATACGCPALSLANDVDWILQSRAHCASIDELVARSREILHSKDVADMHVRDVRQTLEKLAGPRCFANQIKAFQAKLLTSNHSIHSFQSRPTDGVQFDFNLLTSRARMILRYRTFAQAATLRCRTLSRVCLVVLGLLNYGRRLLQYGHL